MHYHPNTVTVVLATIFMVGYLTHLFRRVVAERVDLYDFFLLSTVALCPSGILYFPELSEKVSRAAGVSYPFILLFGFLFFVVFVFLHRMVAMGKANERRITTLVQELAILRGKVSENSVQRISSVPSHGEATSIDN